MIVPDLNFDIATDERADNTELDRMKPQTEEHVVQNVNPPPADGRSEIEQRQGTTFVAEPPAPAPVAAAPADFSEAEDIFAAFNQYSTPKPVYDEKREKRLQTMAGAEGVAKALMTLGDAFALHKGGLIRPRQMETNNQYINQITEDQRAFKEKEYNAEMQARADKLKGALTVAEAKSRDRKMQAALEQQAIDNARAEKEFALKAGDRERAEYWKQKELELEEKKFGEGVRRAKVEEAQGARRLDITEEANAMRMATSLAKKSGKEFVLYNPDGKGGVMLDTPGQLEAVYSAILKDPDPSLRKEASDLITLLKGSMEGGATTNAQKIVASRFWHRSPAAIEFLKGQGMLKEQGSPVPKYIYPVEDTQAAQDTTKKGEWF